MDSSGFVYLTRFTDTSGLSRLYLHDVKENTIYVLYKAKKDVQYTCSHGFVHVGFPMEVVDKMEEETCTIPHVVSEYRTIMMSPFEVSTFRKKITQNLLKKMYPKVKVIGYRDFTLESREDMPLRSDPKTMEEEMHKAEEARKDNLDAHRQMVLDVLGKDDGESDWTSSSSDVEETKARDVDFSHMLRRAKEAREARIEAHAALMREALNDDRESEWSSSSDDEEETKPDVPDFLAEVKSLTQQIKKCQTLISQSLSALVQTKRKM